MRALPIVLLIALGSTAVRAQEAIPVATVAVIKDATTFIRTSIDSEPDGPTISGSGFLIRTEGTTGYIVTNAHVITLPRGRELFSTRPTTKVHFRSGTKAESKAVAEVVASAPERDLAILKVANVPNLPRPIDLKADTEPFETMTVYIFGFPFGQALAMGKGNPPVNVGRGQVSSMRRNEDDRITSVLVDGALNPGNSGGPVVDTKGKLVGISVATIRGANIGFAIAVPVLLDMLDGQAEGTSLAVKSVNGGAAELAVEVALIDPLDKVKSARLLYTTGEAKFSRTKRAKAAAEAADKDSDDADGPLARAKRSQEPESIYGPIEGAKTIPLNIGKHRAVGLIKLPAAGKDVAIWCQVAYVDGSGKTIHAKPGRHFLGAAKPADKGTGESGGLTVWGEVVDPDLDCRLKMENGDLVADVPGTLHDLNIDIDKNNAPRVVQEVDGDFVASVKVMGSFHPGPDRTGPKSVPYNGGGVVVWLDQDHYIRMERASMYRSNRVMGFLAYESRELGTRAGVHNKGGLDPTQDLWLRLERHGHVFSGFFSKDGQAWEELQPMDVEWPSRLKVGVDMINSCGDPMTVRFQDYSLKKLGSGTAGG
jgi:regulation of enolase protein 1 (concanavalin A-like superfamily)